MNRTVALGVGAAAMAVAGGIVVAGTAVAAGGSHSHTLTLASKPLQEKDLGSSNSVEADALTQAGKKVGYASESCNFGGMGDKCAVTFALKGGILLGNYTFPISSSGIAPTHASGKVTGGIGRFAGDTGTIKVVATASHGKFTITYH